MHDDQERIDPRRARALWLKGVPSRRRLERVRTARSAVRRQRETPLPHAPTSGEPAFGMYVAYAVGDLVVPTDLPRHFVCRVTDAATVGGTMLQVLELEPLEGPWPPETRLIRGGEIVRPATPTELWELWGK